MKDILINDEHYFSKETIEKIRVKYNFSQSVHIEMLLWDFEIFTQLSAINKDITLKGGAATQIYLESDKQRASRDIDFATSLTKKEVEEALTKISLKFKDKKKQEDHFTWTPISPPKKQEKRIEDLDCYNIVVPTNFGKSIGKENATNLKIDSIHYKEIPFSVKEIKNPVIFGLPLKPFKIVSEGSLIADKLLTLADSTVGILALNKDNFDGYLKQLYDLNHLIDKFILNSNVQKEIINTLEKLTPIELKYRELTKSVTDVLKDIISSLDARKHFDYESNEEMQDFRNALESFKGNYLNKSQWATQNEWAARIGKIKFVAEVLLANKEKKISLEELNKTLERIYSAEQLLRNLKGENIKEVRLDLMQHSSGKKDIQKKLKNGPILKVFYGILSLENAEKLFDIIGVQREKPMHPRNIEN